jgi:NADH-quinone oxidoreductase subunit C
MKSRRKILARGESAGDEWIAIAPDAVRETLTELRGQGYEALAFLTCVDHLAQAGSDEANRFELVYELRSYEHRKVLRVRVFLAESTPAAPSVADLYPNANWDERETYDMFGITFDGHPNLTRILNPDDWVGHPLRRDYPVGGEPVDFSEEHEVWETTPPQA